MHLVYNKNEVNLDNNIRITYYPETKSIRLTFNIKSMVNCYRKKEGDNLTWILRITDDRADALYISNLRLVSDWTQLKTKILEHTYNFNPSEIDKMLDVARSFRQNL